MPPARIRYKGGRSARYHPAERTTAVGRPRAAPQWTPAAAAVAAAATQEAAAAAGYADRVPFLLSAMHCASQWAALVVTVRAHCSRHMGDLALTILEHHRVTNLCEPDIVKRAARVANLGRVMRRRAAECPAPPKLDIPLSSGQVASFHSWIDAVSTGSQRPSPGDAGPLLRFSEWGLDRVPHAGVVCFARAGGRVRAQRARARSGPGRTAPPSLELASALVHKTILMTALATRGDHYWLTGQRRYMSVAEVSRAFGLRESDALFGALQRVPCPTTAVTLLGRSLHAGVAELLVA